MAKTITIMGIVLLFAGAALVVAGTSQTLRYFVSCLITLGEPPHVYVSYEMLDLLPAAMPLVPGSLLVVWATRLKRKNLSQNGSE